MTARPPRHRPSNAPTLNLRRQNGRQPLARKTRPWRGSAQGRSTLTTRRTRGRSAARNGRSSSARGSGAARTRRYILASALTPTRRMARNLNHSFNGAIRRARARLGAIPKDKDIVAELAEIEGASWCALLGGFCRCRPPRRSRLPPRPAALPRHRVLHARALDHGRPHRPRPRPRRLVLRRPLAPRAQGLEPVARHQQERVES